MRNLVFFLIVTAISVGALNAQSKKSDVFNLDLSGLKCKNCVDKIETALKGIKGVENVEVSLEKSQATVKLASNAIVKPDILVKAVADAGYSAAWGKIKAEPGKATDMKECEEKEEKCSMDEASGGEKGSCCGTKKDS